MKILKNLLSLLLGVGQKETLEDMLKKAPFRTVLFFFSYCFDCFPISGAVDSKYSALKFGF
jgi:hypothetical protein